MDDLKRQEYINRLKQIQRNNDYEIAHGDADEVLLEILEDLGYSDIIEEYNKVEKYYS